MRVRSLLVVVVVIIGLTTARAGAAPANTPSDEVVLAGLNEQSLEIVDSAATSLGIDRLAAVHKLRFQSAAAETVAKARTIFGDAFAGARFDPDNEVVTIGIVGNLPDSVSGVAVGGVTVSFLKAALSEKAFAKARDSVSVELYAGKQQVAMRSDDTTSSVVFSLAVDASDGEHASAKAAIAAATSLGLTASVEEIPRKTLINLTTPNPLSCTKPSCDRIQGGIAIGQPGYGGDCTSSVLAQRTNGVWYQFTAGHCNPPTGGCSGTQPVISYANGSNTIGSFNAACYEIAVPLDMGGIQVTSSMQLGLSTHMTNANSSTQYRPLGPLTAAPSGGEYLCQTGFVYYSHIGNYACGYASSYGIQTVGGHQRYWVNLPGCHGDSGALVAKQVFFGGQFHYQATGMISVGDTGLPNWNGYADCYGAVGITALATEFAVWNGWGWGLTYYSDPNY